jgi:hypothetical protein
MNATIPIVLRSALYMVLLYSPPMLSAEGGESIYPADRLQAPQAAEAEHPSYIKLLPEQLDTVKGGLVCFNGMTISGTPGTCRPEDQLLIRCRFTSAGLLCD